LKTDLTNTISELIQYDYAGGAVSKPIIKTEYYSDTQSTWKEFDNDIEKRQIELSIENRRYLDYSFLPPSKKLKLTLNNFYQVYSTGSGNSKANILKKNLLIRCWSGYESFSIDSNIARYGSAIYGSSVYSTAGSYTQYLFKQGVFIIDDPVFRDTKIEITGRDYLRRALETEINLPQLNSINVANVITKILDRCNIPYDTSTWDVTSTTITVNSTLAENLNNISGWKALNYTMDCLNAGDDDWVFRFNEDGNPELKKLTTDIEADWTIHYKYNIESISKGLDSLKQLQRVTIMNKNIIVDTESTLKEISGTASASLHVTYATALYVRYEDDLNAIISEYDRGNTGITFTMNSGVNYNIKIFGCALKNTLSDEIFEEFGNSDNIKNKHGSTWKLVNPMMDSTKAKEFAKYIINKNANPEKRIELIMNINPLIELQDNLMVFDKYTYTDDIYGLVSIVELWTNPALKQKLVLKDRGFNLGNFVWDRNGLISGINDLKYDKGFVFDQDLPINATSDASDYSNTKELAFRSV